MRLADTPATQVPMRLVPLVDVWVLPLTGRACTTHKQASACGWPHLFLEAGRGLRGAGGLQGLSHWRAGSGE
jgi:hypothetical protein